MRDKALNGEYSSPELEVIEAVSLKVICQSDEAPDFIEGWEFDF